MSTREHPARHAFSIIGLSLFSAFIVGSFALTALYMPPLIAGNQLAAVVTATLVDLANTDRSGEQLGTLTVNPVLVAAAQAKANDMATKGYFAHTSPDGHDSWYWFKEAGYSFSYAGENLAVNFSDSANVETAWMNSPTHRANILNGRFTEIGIATAVGEYQGRKTTFVVQLFGRPSAAPSAPVTVLPTSAEPEAVALATTENVPVAVLGTESAAAAVETNAPPAPLPEGVAAPIVPHAAGFFMSSPQRLLQVIYVVCALIILVALLLAMRFEWKQHHVRHVLAAVFLFALMGGLFSVADWLVFTKPIVG